MFPAKDQWTLEEGMSAETTEKGFRKDRVVGEQADGIGKACFLLGKGGSGRSNDWEE